MAKRIRVSDDEILIKRTFEKRENATKSTYNYNKKNFQKKEYKNSYEVLVKITGNAKNFDSLSRHIDYVSRNGDVDLYLDEYIIMQGKEGKNEVKEIFKNSGIPIETSPKKEIRQTVNIVFSMKDYINAPEDKMKTAVMQTLQQKYTDNFYAMAFHNDTDNPHCHVILKLADSYGKRINPRKNDLNEIRELFAKNLNNLDVNAYATINKKFTKDVIKDEKMHYHEVVDFGSANYKFNKTNKPSYYIKYKTKSGVTTIWSDDLERLVKENNIRKGSYAKFKRTKQTPVNVEIQKRINGKIKTFTKTVHRSSWECDILTSQKDIDVKLKMKSKYNENEVKNIDKRGVKKE